MKQFILGLATATLMTTAIGADWPPFKKSTVSISACSVHARMDDNGVWEMAYGSDKKIYYYEASSTLWRLYTNPLPIATSTQ